MTATFSERRWRGSDGLDYVLEPFTTRALGKPDGRFAKLYRKGLRDSQAAMRLEIDDLGVLAMHAREAFMEAIGRVSLEVTADQLREGDAIEGLGEISSVAASSALSPGVKVPIIVEISKSKTQVVFYPENDKYTQLIDITRDISA